MTQCSQDVEIVRLVQDEYYNQEQASSSRSTNVLCMLSISQRTLDLARSRPSVLSAGGTCVSTAPAASFVDQPEIPPIEQRNPSTIHFLSHHTTIRVCAYRFSSSSSIMAPHEEMQTAMVNRSIRAIKAVRIPPVHHFTTTNNHTRSSNSSLTPP